MAEIRAVIFDMDGLLIDTEPIWRRSEIEIFGALGLHLTEEQCMQTMGVRVREVVELWYQRHPWSGASTAEVTRQIIDSVIEHVSLEGEPKIGVLNALRLVHEACLPVAIASSSSEDLIDAVVKRLDIGEYIDATCSADREEHGKPHPAVYFSAARKLHAHPRACLALEDSPNGVLAAKAAGMYCIVVPDPHLASDPRMEEADLTLGSLDDFTPSLLAQLTGRPISVPGVR